MSQTFGAASEPDPGQQAHQMIRSVAAPAATVPDANFPAPDARPAPDVASMLLALRRRWWMPLLGAAAGVGVAAYVARSADPVYQARAVVRLSEGRRALTGGLVDGRGDAAPRQSADPTLSLLEVLTSRAVAGRVVDSADVSGLRVKASGFSAHLLADVVVRPQAPPRPAIDTLRLTFGPHGFHVRADGVERGASYGAPVEAAGVVFTIAGPPRVSSGVIFVLPREHAIDALIGRLRVRVRPKTDVIDVTYTARNPATAQRVVNAVVKTFRDMTAQSSQQQSRRRREFIEGQLRRNDSLLAVAEDAMGTFRQQGRVYDARQRLAAAQAELSALESRVAEVDADLGVYYGLRDRIAGAPGNSGREEIGALLAVRSAEQSPVIAQLSSQLASYQAVRDSLTTGPWARSAAHPDVLRTDTLIVATEGRIRSAIESQIAALQMRRSLLAERRVRSAEELTHLPSAELQEARLEQQLESLRKLTDGLRTEYQKAQIEEAVEMGQVDVLDLAPLPKNPVGLAQSMLLALGLLIGTLVGGGTSVAADQLNTSIRRREELGSLLQLPELATIPRTVRSGRAPWRTRWLPAADRLGVRARTEPRRGGALVTWNGDPRGAEAYRMLRTSLSFSPGLRSARTLMVTSSAPREGKTTVACNLAASYAQQGARVLLVDGDVWRPGVHTMFGLPRRPGLAEVLQARQPREDAIRATAVENLFVVTAGGPPERSADPLSRLTAPNLLGALASGFDLVVIDSPPVLVAADAAILGAAADAVVLVVCAGRTGKDEARDALRKLTAVGARVIGAVLNDPYAKIDGYAPAYARPDAPHYYAARS